MSTDDRLLYFIFNRANPIVESASGYHYADREGNRFLDATSGAFNCVLGHTVPERIAEVFRSQPSRLSYASLAFFENEPANKLAGKLLDLFGHYAAAGFYQSGSDAVEAALRCAVQAARTRFSPGKTKIIGRSGTYHGLTMGALGVGDSYLVRDINSPIFRHIPRQNCFDCELQLTYPECRLRCASELEQVILREGPDTVAAFVGVPSGSGGPVPDEYWAGIRRTCDKYDVLLVCDDVLEGLWRIGVPVGLNRWGVTPDVLATGKALGAGFVPLFATLVTPEVREALSASGRFAGGHTYTGHPLSCEVACAVLDELQLLMSPASTRMSFIERRLGEVLGGVAEYFQDTRFAVLGAYARLRIGCRIADPEAAYVDVQRMFRKHGLLVWIESIGQDHLEIRLGPPYIADEAFFFELDRKLRSAVAGLRTAPFVQRIDEPERIL